MSRSIIGRIVRRAGRRRPRGEIAPSFNAKFAAARRLRQRLHDQGLDHPVWEINDKDASHAFAAEHGWRRPHLVGIYPSAGEIPWARLPDHVVVKPVHGTLSRGVFLVSRSCGAWRRASDGTPFDTAAAVEHLTALATAGVVSREVLVETLVVDAHTGRAPPIDWKIFTFHGEVGMLCAKRNVDGGRRWRFFDADLRDLGAAIEGHRLDCSIPPPLHGDALVAMARDISAAIPVPMLRVDLYDGVEGATFGEITPEPGLTRRVLPPHDERLGRLWEEAEARIMARLIRSGAMEVTRGTPATLLEVRELARHG